MSTKFGLLIDYGLLRAATSMNPKPAAVLSGHDRHLEKWIRDLNGNGDNGNTAVTADLPR